MHVKTQLLNHAKKYVADKGKIEIRNFRRQTDCFAATIIITLPTEIQHYAAYIAGGAIGMIKTKSTRLQALPLLLLTEPPESST